MKPSLFVFHILLLSSGISYSAEVTAGWHLSEECFDDPHPCDVTHYNFADDHDLLKILKLLDKVREGFFCVVIVLPMAARRAGPGGQPPARSRSHPWGIPEATPPLYEKTVHHSRRFRRARHRNHVAARRHFSLGLASPLTQYSRPVPLSLLENSSGSFVLRRYAARWSLTPSRLEVLRASRHNQTHRFSPSLLFRTLGRKYTSSGNYASSPGTYFENTPILHSWTNTSLVPMSSSLVRGSVHDFAYDDTVAELCLVLGYRITYAWSYGSSPGASGAEGSRRWQRRIDASCFCV